MDNKISDLQRATLPLTGAKLIEVAQSENTCGVQVMDLLPGPDREALSTELADPTKGAALVAITGPDGDTNVKSILAGLFAGVVSPFMFGVAKDGITDYTENLRRMHNYANENGCRVDYHGLTSCQAQADAHITLNTDVDFAGCNFKLLNGIVETPKHVAVKTLFSVLDPSRASFPISLAGSELYEGAVQLTVPDTVLSGYLRLASDKEIPRRTSAPEIPLYFEQGFMVSKGGLLNFPLGTSLVSNAVAATFYPASDKWLTIRGIAADETTFNNQCLLCVRRCNVIVDTPYIDLLQNSAIPSVNCLLAFRNCGSVILRNMAMRSNTEIGGSGTYTINLDHVADVTFENCRSRGRTTWGATGCNHVNGWRLIDCDLNRIDVHAGMHNLTVRGGSLHGEPIQYGWGTGFIDVTNIAVLKDQPLVRSRNDYSGEFDGDISIRDVCVHYGTLAVSAGGLLFAKPLVFFDRIGSAGYSIRMCRTLTIDHVLVSFNGDEGQLLMRPVLVEKSGRSEVVIAPNRVEIGNIRSNSRQISLSVQMALHQLTNALGGKLVLHMYDMEPFPQPLHSLFEVPASITEYLDSNLKVEVHADNVQGYTQYSATPGAIVKIRNSKVYCINAYCGGDLSQEIYLRNVEFSETISIGGSAVGDSGNGAAKLVIDGALVKSQSSLVAAKAIRGLLVETGVPDVSLPVGATLSTAYTGWFDAAVYKGG